MKITKRQLRRIIKEEKARLLSESAIKLDSLATKQFARAVKGKSTLSEVTPGERDDAKRLDAEWAASVNAEQDRLQSQADISRQLGDLHDAIDRLITVMGFDEVANELEGIAEEIRMEMV